MTDLTVTIILISLALPIPVGMILVTADAIKSLTKRGEKNDCKLDS